MKTLLPSALILMLCLDLCEPFHFKVYKRAATKAAKTTGGDDATTGDTGSDDATTGDTGSDDATTGDTGSDDETTGDTGAGTGHTKKKAVTGGGKGHTKKKAVTGDGTDHTGDKAVTGGAGGLGRYFVYVNCKECKIKSDLVVGSKSNGAELREGDSTDDDDNNYNDGTTDDNDDDGVDDTADDNDDDGVDGTTDDNDDDGVDGTTEDGGENAAEEAAEDGGEDEMVEAAEEEEALLSECTTPGSAKVRSQGSKKKRPKKSCSRKKGRV